MHFSRRQTLLALSGLLACSRREERPAPAAGASGTGATTTPTTDTTSAPGPHETRREVHAGVEVLSLFTRGADTRSPVLVAIHGRGDRPEAWIPDLQRFPGKAQIVVPRAFDAFGDGFTWFPLTRGMDEAALASVLADAEARLFRALASVAAGRPLLVSGFSQGGMLSFVLAARRGKDITFATPMAGMCPASLVPGKEVPVARVVAFHGTADPVVPFAAGRAAVDAFVRNGHEASMHPYEGVLHALPSAMRADVYAELTRRLAT